MDLKMIYVDTLNTSISKGTMLISLPDIQYLRVKGQGGRRTLQDNHLVSHAKWTPTQWHELKQGCWPLTNQLADRPQHDTHSNPPVLDGSNGCVIPVDRVSACWNLNMKHRLLLIKHSHWITEHVKSMSVSTWGIRGPRSDWHPTPEDVCFNLSYVCSLDSVSTCELVTGTTSSKKWLWCSNSHEICFDSSTFPWLESDFQGKQENVPEVSLVFVWTLWAVDNAFLFFQITAYINIFYSE